MNPDDIVVLGYLQQDIKPTLNELRQVPEWMYASPAQMYEVWKLEEQREEERRFARHIFYEFDYRSNP